MTQYTPHFLQASVFVFNRIYHVDDVPSGSVDGVFDYSKAIQVGALNGCFPQGFLRWFSSGLVSADKET